MKSVTTALALALAGAISTPALAQTGQQAQQEETQRDVNQQKRIEQGLKSGELTTREAGRLEREQNAVDKMEAHAAANGKVSPAEQRRIDAAQTRVSHDIHAQKHDAQIGNPDSASSRRMQADVQRDVLQEKRIRNGVSSGELTTREAGRLEHQQARADRMQANAAADGHVGAREQRTIRRTQTRDSRRIRRQKHDAQTR